MNGGSSVGGSASLFPNLGSANEGPSLAAAEQPGHGTAVAAGKPDVVVEEAPSSLAGIGPAPGSGSMRIF